MNINNKLHGLYLDYQNCLILQKLGLPQDDATAYWFKNDKRVYPAESIPKLKGWEKLYIAAVTGDELNHLLPVGTECRKEFKHLYILKYNDLKASALTESEAKAVLIQKLAKKGIITL